MYRYDSNHDRYAEKARFRTNNPVAPVEILLTNDGWLVALDNWHNFGIGSVVAVYNLEGDGIVTLSLSDIFTSQQLDELDRSVSSIWWRCDSAKLDDTEGSIVISDSTGRIVSIDYLTGMVKVMGESGRCIDDDA